jgi:hypothetical protein
MEISTGTGRIRVAQKSAAEYKKEADIANLNLSMLWA